MKQIITVLTSVLLFNFVYGQDTTKIKRVKVVFGVSAPELIHAGMTVRISNSSMAGVNAGFAPSWGEAIVALSFEHRLYFGRNSKYTGQKVAFFRQGLTFIPSSLGNKHYGFDLTIGKDLIFRNPNTGMTIDAGIFFIPQSRSDENKARSTNRNIFFAVRFEVYF